jgi:HSP20 family protein
MSRLRKPSYDCREHADTVKLTVYVPGVEAAGVEIEVRGPDLVVTARKVHFVRVNWQALHLESAQRDYQLRLRLGHGVDYTALHAEIHQGLLTVVLPKRIPVGESLAVRRVA